MLQRHQTASHSLLFGIVRFAAKGPQHARRLRVNTEVEHLTFQLDEVTIHAAAAGPQEGPVVILLHGFPEFWYGWRGQIASASHAGG